MADMKKNRVAVDILGHSYKMVGTESVDHMRYVALLVDEKMREIKVHNPSLDINKLAVLTALNVVNDYVLLQEKVEKLEQQLNELKD